MRPGVFAEHLVALEARLVGLTEGISCSPYTDILHQAEIARLMADQGFVEDVGCFFVIRLDASVN